MGWNSLVEGMRRSTGSENPVEDLARQNEAVERAVGGRKDLEALVEENRRREAELASKRFELEAKREFLREQQQQLAKYW